MKASALAAGACVMAISFTPQSKAACPEAEGRWGYGQVTAVATSGSHAYTGSGTVFLVLDISAPAAPAVLGRLLLPGMIRGLAASGSYVYVGDDSGGLRVVDVSSPASPVEVGSSSHLNRAQAVVVSGNYAYIVSASHLGVFDVSVPADPAEVGWTTFTGSGQGLAVAGGYAFVAAQAGDLQVIDIATPSAPTVVGSLVLPGNAQRLAIHDNYAYVASTVGGLQIVDITVPTAPSVAGALATPDLAWDVALLGAYVLVAADQSGVRVIDVATPASPAEVASVDTPGTARGLAVAGSYAYVADLTDGLRVIDVSAPASLSEAGHLDLPDEAWGAAISGDRVYIADQYAGLRILDVADPANPSELGSVDTAGNARGVFVSGDHAYVADEQALRVIDVTAPESATEVGSVVTGFALGVVVAGDFAYVAGKDGGMIVVDVSSPTNPTQVAAVGTPGEAYDIALSGSLAFVADGAAGLQVFDISTPTAPAPVGSVDTPGLALGVAVSGSYAYVADAAGGVRVVDVADPAHPAEVASIATWYAEKVAVAGDRLFLADETAGLRVFSIANPASPEEVGVFDTLGIAYGVAAAGGLVVVADGHAGAALFDVSDCPDTLCELSCSATATPASGPAPLDVAFSAVVTTESCTSPVTYRWQPGDGSPDLTQQNASHQYAAGSFTWTFTAASGAASCSASGTITATAPEITVLDGAAAITAGQASPVVLGTTVQGSAGAPRVFTVRNDGLGTLTLGTLAAPAGFVVVEGLSASLAAGASDTFTIRLDTATTGVRSGILSFTTNDADENPFSFPVAGTVVAPPPRRLDFGTGTSDVASGYTRATTASAYTAAAGWGWLPATLGARDRGNAFSDLNQDFVFTANATFLVDLPNGAWDVTVTMGDGTNPHDQMGVSLEGSLASTLTTGAGQFITRALRATVADNQLTVRFQDLGGSDAVVVINGLSITPAPPFRFDFGTATSPVASSYAQVTESTAYNAFLAYGWGAGAVQSRSRASGTDLTRDFNFTPNATFLADIANGVYDVTVTMGDATAAHDQMGVAFEAGPANLVSTNRGQWSTKTYRVTVADGQLTMLVNDAGGADPNAVVNALVVAPASYRFDFGTLLSPVASGYTQVTSATTYSAARGYGWLSGTVAGRDRGTGTELLRDFNFTALATFAVDVPAGSWDVTISIADASSGHDQMGFFLEGASVGSYTVPAGATQTFTSRVTVADAQLTLLLDDLGGTDAYVVINGLELQPVSP